MKQLIIYSILIYWVVVNIVTFALWRIEESTLLLWAAFGGSVGALLGMKVWHHKTLHKKFKYGVPAILIAQIALAGVVVYSILT